MKRVLTGIFLAVMFISRLFAEGTNQPKVIGPFGGLNNTDSSVVIPENNAQDLLNVDLSLGGKSVIQRKGYGLAYALPITTSAVHGVYDFYNGSGSEISLSFNDAYLTSVVNGGSTSVLFSTGPNGATYQCVDSQGFAYCANTSRTNIIKTDGTTYSTIVPLATGTLVAVTPDRLVLGGFSTFPNRIDFSAAADFTSWTTGVSPTSAFNFTITAPGSRITHLTYAFNRIIWFKETSFGYVLPGANASDWVVKTISPNIGSLDNTSVYDKGILYFRNQEGHIYAYDGSNLKKLTRDIGATISSAGLRTLGIFTQTTQSDWQAGSIPNDVSATITVGDLISKTTSFIVTGSTSWNSGSFTGPSLFIDTTTTVGSLATTFPDTFSSYRDGSSGSKNLWTNFNAPTSVSSDGSQLTIQACNGNGAGIVSSSLMPNYAPGTTYYFKLNALQANGGGGIATDFILNTSSTVASPALTGTRFKVILSSTASRVTIAVSNNTDGLLFTDGVPGVFPIDLSIYLSTNNYSIGIGTKTNSGTHNFSNGQNYLFVLNSLTSCSITKLDSFNVVPQTFSWISSTYDTGISSPVWSLFTNNVSTSAGSIAFASQVSNDGSSFDSSVSVSSGSVIASNPKRYIRFVSTFTCNVASGTSVVLNQFNFNSGSSGTFKSQVKNAPSLTAWDTFLANTVLNGGTISFFIRASTNSFTINSSTPAWTSVANGATPSIATGTYLQVRADFYAPSSTNPSTMNDFTVNWIEGSASDNPYAAYFKDAIWWSVTAGNGSTTNNRILRYDLINSNMDSGVNTWLLYDLPVNGFYVRNNSLYFGASTSGNVFKFGDSTNDNGSAINSYWKSKDFFNESPFTDDDITDMSVFFKAVNASTITVTYTLVGSSSTAYTIPTTRTNASFGVFNRNLPLGTVGNTFNVKFGNNSTDQPFEVYAIQYGTKSKPWKPGQ